MTKEMINKINDAIRTVVTTRFKKDAKESHEFLEGLGYVISKWDGRFNVTNTKTDKTITVDESYIRCGYIAVRKSYYKNHEYISRLKKFDYYSCLETPKNNNRSDVHKRCNKVSWNYDHYYRNDIQKNFDYNKNKLNSNKWDVKYYTRELADAQKKLADTIAKLQHDIVYYTERKVIAEHELAELRKSFKK